MGVVTQGGGSSDKDLTANIDGYYLFIMVVFPLLPSSSAHRLPLCAAFMRFSVWLNWTSPKIPKNGLHNFLQLLSHSHKRVLVKVPKEDDQYKEEEKGDKENENLRKDLL